MRQHAKAQSAGSTERRAIGLGSLIRGADATRAPSLGGDGSGASSHRRPGLALVLVLTALTALLALFAASASASVTHNLAPFTPNPITGFSRPSGVAVDQSTGNVFLADGSSANKVRIFGEEGGAPTGLIATEITEYEGTNLSFGTVAAGMAYDNACAQHEPPLTELTTPTCAEYDAADSTLYVYQFEKILKYTRNGTTEEYEAAGEIPAPGTGESFGSFVGLAVDGKGNVWLGDNSSKSVYEWSSAGALLHEYDFSEHETGFPNAPSGVAVDSAGDLFVQRQAGSSSSGGVYKFPANGSGEIDPASYERFVFENAKGVAYDPATNHVYVTVSRGVLEFDATTLEPIVTHPFGEATLGNNTERVAVNSAKEWIYVADRTTAKKDIAVFGPGATVPTVSASAASEITGTKATLNGSVNPEGVEVSECFFEYGETSAFGHVAPCEETIPADSETHPVSAKITGLKSNGASYVYRLVAENENGEEWSTNKTLETAGTVVTEAAGGVGTEAATLNGLVRPEGLQYSECLFEYKRSTEASFHQIDCEPEAAEIEPDFAAHHVSAQLEELDPNSTYEFRLKAPNSGIPPTHEGEILIFTTPGPPQITEIRARDATEGSVTLEAKIDPSGFGTTYRFEWGPTASYGNQIPPGYESSVPSANEAKHFSVSLSGLSPTTAYHYRIVAKSNAGTTYGPDQSFQTLNSCGLPDGRCFELVSPKERELGPAAGPGRGYASYELLYQAAPRGPGELAYSVDGGLPDSTRGGLVLYAGHRNQGAETWESSQVSPQIVAQNEKAEGGANPSNVLGLTPDLSCSVVASSQPLTSSPAAKLAIEAGGGNLYRRNADGSYDLLTYLAPENLEAVSSFNEFPNYELIDLSADCGRIVFESDLHYPGIEGAGERRLYEWHNGVLSNVAVVPDGGGDAPGEIDSNAPSHLHALSNDGSRVFFAATSQTGNDSGKQAVFARIDGAETLDLSISPLAVDTGATYQGATPDGSKVYFTANAGLSAETSAGGTDLYEYDFAAPEGERLTDLSVEEAEGGAEVGGLLGFADDGSHVYFAARAQLVSGKGKTRVQNLDDNTFSVYDRTGGFLAFVGTVTGSDLRTGVGVGGFGGSGGQSSWTSRVSPDGRYLLFESTANVTGYESDGTREAYLYDGQVSVDPTVCVSCRQDGKAPIHAAGSLKPLARGQRLADAPYSLAVSSGVARVFFVSEEDLASGGREGEGNVYEWSHGQVFHIATEPAGAAPAPEQPQIEFVGASADGSDLYFFDAAALNWENPDGRYAAWDARVGGGFPEPPPAPEGCKPAEESSCQDSSPGAPTTPSAASQGFQGEGNVTEAGSGGANRCTSKARQAQRLTARARKLRRNASKLGSNGKRGRAAKLNRKARNLARKAKHASNRAKSCRNGKHAKVRVHRRTNHNRRAGK